MKISDILQKIGKFFGFIPKDKEVIRYCKLLTIKKVEKNNKIIDELFEIIKSDKISVVHKEDEDSFFQFIECDVTREFVFSKLTGYDDLYDYVLVKFYRDLVGMNCRETLNEVVAYQKRWYLHLIDQLIYENKKLFETVKRLEELGELNG